MAEVSEMVERIARKICCQAGENPDHTIAVHEIVGHRGGSSPAIYYRPIWRSYEATVRIVIAEMWEPTCAIVSAMSRIHPDDDGDREHAAMWRAGIDAALKE